MKSESLKDSMRSLYLYQPSAVEVVGLFSILQSQNSVCNSRNLSESVWPSVKHVKHLFLFLSNDYVKHNQSGSFNYHSIHVYCYDNKKHHTCIHYNLPVKETLTVGSRMERCVFLRHYLTTMLHCISNSKFKQIT